jgi:hypothetical protein
VAGFPVYVTEPLDELPLCTVLVEGGLSLEARASIERHIRSWTMRFTAGDDPPLKGFSEVEFFDSDLGTAVSWDVEVRRENGEVWSALVADLEQFSSETSTPIHSLIFGEPSDPWHHSGSRVEEFD